MTVSSATWNGDLQNICLPLDKRIDEVIRQIGKATGSKTKAQELLQKLAVASVLDDGDCGWMSAEDWNLVQSTGVARSEKKRVCFEEACVAEYLLATAVVNRLYNFVPSCAEIDADRLSRVLTHQKFERLRSFLNWKIGLVSITRSISKDAMKVLKSLSADKINLTFVTIKAEHLFHVDNMLSEAGLKNVIKSDKSAPKISIWAYFKSFIGSK